MCRNRPADDAYAALGRALTALLEPIIRQAVQEAVATALQQSGAPQTSRQPLGFSPEDAATYAGVSRSTFYNEIYPLVLAGQIQSYKVGRRRVIIIESLRTWLHERARHPQ
jgi:excisionase family DNA binding protein